MVVRFAPSKNTILDVISAVQESKISITDLTTEETDLEEVFISLTSE